MRSRGTTRCLRLFSVKGVEVVERLPKDRSIPGLWRVCPSRQGHLRSPVLGRVRLLERNSGDVIAIDIPGLVVSRNSGSIRRLTMPMQRGPEPEG